MRQGDEVHYFYVVVNGCIVATVTDAKGRVRKVGDLIDGESIGASQLLTNGPTTVTIFAERDTALVKFSREKRLIG